MNECGSFKASDGLEIYYRLWKIENPKAVFVIVHGVGEHSVRHAEAALFFNSKGANVYAADLRGHGNSGGRRGHINSFTEYLSDLSIFLDIVRRKEPDKKIFLLGQSLGGLIVLEYVLMSERGIFGVIACAPSLGIIVPIPTWKKSIAHLISLFCPTFTMKDNSLSSEYLSHDKEVSKAYDKDPLVHRFRSVRFYTELVKTMRFVRANAYKIEIPVMLLQGDQDMIVSKTATEDFFKRLGSSNKQLKLYEGFYHEPMHEIGKEKVLSDIILWCGL